MKKISLAEALEGIEDRRREKSVLYPLHEVLIIMLLAIICGATSYAKIEMFGKSKEEWLKKFLKLENGIPDACTFRYIVKEIDTAKLHTIFCEWMKNVAVDLTGVIAIDGKEARRTKDKRKKPLHVVSAFSYERGLVLGQLACDEKSNEITAIPQLLEMLEINGCIITIDAMGTQTEIAEEIVNRNADYILALKANQTSLYNDVKLLWMISKEIMIFKTVTAIAARLKDLTAELKKENVLFMRRSVGSQQKTDGRILGALVQYILRLQKTAKKEKKAIILSIAVKGFLLKN